MQKKTFQYSRAFDEAYSYEGKDLGARCGAEGTTFKVWAPLAEKAEVCLWKDGEKIAQWEMKKEAQGVFSLHCVEYLHGSYYQYRIWHEGKPEWTVDPYATACSLNGEFSMVVDLKKTDPEGFENDHAPANQEETVIYEMHIRDFSEDPDSGIPEAIRGKYKAFTVKPEPKEYLTGIQHLQALGVTHIHLLPFFDYGWLDEAKEGKQYNWGYDPVNYNVPEGSYATDPRDGVVRIRECKEMIQALHQAGFRVVMDVVYNHTYEETGCFARTVPGYYYRTLKNGEFSDGSACGNDMAAGRAMVDNYILHSVLYWAKEYHVDGFRFDLMGLLTTDLMNRIREELDAAYGKGEKLLYGEPWRARTSPMEKGTYGALKEHVQKLSPGIAVFSDDTRDLLKGSAFEVMEPGFVNGAEGLEEQILHAVSGWKEGSEGIRPRDCSQMIQYLSAHDNYTLWDKLLISMKPEALHAGQEFYLYPHPEVLAANKLAALICFTCQGYLFLHAGEEFGRTKFGDENSFRSPGSVNMLRWRQTQSFHTLVSYYKGLISLRKKLPGFCDKAEDADRRITGKEIRKKGVVSFLVDNRKVGAEVLWSEIFVLYNASEEDYLLLMPKGSWELLADGEETDIRKQLKDKILVPAHTGMIAGRIEGEQ